MLFQIPHFTTITLNHQILLPQTSNPNPAKQQWLVPQCLDKKHQVALNKVGTYSVIAQRVYCS